MKYDNNVARVWDDYHTSIPTNYLKTKVDLYGHLTIMSTENPVRNTEWDFLYFEDSSVFSPAANNFKKSELETQGTGMDPEYTPALEGSLQYLDYWREELKRCKEGYEVGGVWIPGVYYFYLNFCRIKIKDDEKGEREDFPMFTTMDYYWFLEFDKNSNNKDRTKLKNILAAKARRKGFSFKVAAICVWRYTFFRESKTVIASQLGSKARNTFDFCLASIDFLNRYTEFGSPWTRRKSSDNGCQIVSGKEVKQRGKKFIKGRKSEILTVSLNNKPDAAAGLGASLVIIEEAGMVKDLKKVFGFTEPVLRSGAIRKGIMVMFGTGGDMDGATKDFADMFSNPEAYNCAAYENIYEEGATGTCGWFVDDFWFREGASFVDKDGVLHEAVDANGNPHRWVAEIDLNKERIVKSQGDKNDYSVFLSQHCKTPSEAFLVSQGNVFPVADLFERLSYIKKNSHKHEAYTAGLLVEHMGEIKFRPTELIDDSPSPQTTFPLKPNTKDLRGCIMQYYPPEYINGVIPDDAYIIGHDPWGINAKLDRNTPDTSLGAAYVMRTRRYFKEIGFPNTIVATYVGRTDRMEEYNENLLKLSKYYNAKINFENDRGEVRPFFQNKQQLSRLCASPGKILEKNNVTTTMRNRKFGYSMSNIRFKELGIKYLNDWLLEPTIDDPNLRNLDVLLDKPLIEELLRFNFETGNYDRVMAMVGCVIWQEDNINPYNDNEKKDNKNSFLLNNRLFKR